MGIIRFLLPALLILTTLTQAATIRGRIVASDSLSPVYDANVTVYRDTVFTGMGAATDSLGFYRIPNVPTGKYLLHFEYLGYRPEIRLVEVKDTAEVIVNMVLTPQPLQGEDVEVFASVTKYEISVSNTPIRVEVMVPEEVQDKIAFSTSTDGALRYSGGVTVNNSRNLYEAENIRLRGAESRYLLLLADQAPAIGYQPELPGIWTLPLVGVKQIEIVKGDYSALYGSGQGGVINAVTWSPLVDSLHLFGLARSDFERDHYAGFWTGARTGNWGLSGTFSAQATQNEQKIQQQRYAFLPRLEYQLQGLKAYVSGTYLNAEQDRHTKVFERTGISNGMEVPVGEKSKLGLQIQLADQETRYLSGAAQPLRARSLLDYMLLQYLHTSGKLVSLFGLDGYRENWKMLDDYSGIHSRITHVSLFLQEEWMVSDQVVWHYGGRVTRSNLRSSGPYAVNTSPLDTLMGEITLSTWETNQSLSLLWKLNYLTSLRIGGSYSDIPPFSHYLQQSDDSLKLLLVPSNGLEPERYWNVGCDVKRSGRLGSLDWTGDLSWFFSAMQNRIDIYASGDSTSQLMNISHYRLTGVELFWRLNLSEDAALLLGYTYLSLNDVYRINPGTMLPLPRHQGNFELDWEIEGTGLRVEFEGKLVGKQPTPGSPYRSSAPPYALFGLTAEYRLGVMKFFGGIENLGDFHQTDPGPLWSSRQGREAYLGLKVVLN